MSTTTAAPDFRNEIKRSGHRQWYIWGGFLALVVGLLSLFSAGFFVYTALVVIGLLILSISLARVSLAGINIRRNVSATEISLGESIDTWLTIQNNKAFPALWVFWQDHIDPALDIEGPSCSFQTLGSSGKEDMKYRLHSTRRGFFRIGPTVIESSGPFGLVRRFLVGPTVDFLTVLPRVVEIGKGLAQGHRPIHQVPRRRSIFEDPSRFMGMRDYRPGDSMRRIHWRATARSGKLQVKLFEPSVLTGVLLAPDMGLDSYPLTRSKKETIDPLLERTITAAASLGHYVLSGDQSVGLISNGTDAAELYPEDWTGGSFQRLDDALEKTKLHVGTEGYHPVQVSPAKGQWQQERLLTALARLIPSDSIGLADLLMTELPRLPRQLVLMVITPRLDGELAIVLGSMKRSGIETGVIWIGSEDEQLTLPERIPHNVPVYIVRNDEDIEALGSQKL